MQAELGSRQLIGKMENAKLYDVCIVGAGMIGSAAARHATLESPGVQVCLIGPKEPKDIQACKHGIFGSYYDEGRITRSLDPNPIWAELGRRSIQRYRDLEKTTGVQFYNEVGHMAVSRPDDPYMQSARQNARSMNVNVDELDAQQLVETFPYLSFNTSEVGILQKKGAGHVSPRGQVLAQQIAASRQGCDIIDDVVDQVTETTQSDGSKCMKVRTSKGQVILAKRVLLTTGAFTGFRDLLPAGKEVDARLLGVTVLLAELSDEDGERLRSMPCLIHKENDTRENYDAYILPPIKYPDGKYYLKLGHRSWFRTVMSTAEEVNDWFQSDGHSGAIPVLKKHIEKIVTGVRILSTHTRSCMLTITPTDQLYVDMVTPTLGIAVGGNGYAAKSADEIGKMAVKMIIAGQWNHDLPRDNFRVRFKVKPSKLTAKL